MPVLKRRVGCASQSAAVSWTTGLAGTLHLLDFEAGGSGARMCVMPILS